MTKSLCERRAELAPLKLGDFMTLQGRDPLPVMFVYIKPGPLDDGRVACDPASPPGDRQVLERVEKWWQVKKYCSTWSAAPLQSPGVLVAVYGNPRTRRVVAALRIDRSKWDIAESCDKGLIRVPTLRPRCLDLFELRGRYIESEAGIRFDRIPAGFYVFLCTNLDLRGGRNPRS
jgi:hypothetical protein